MLTQIGWALATPARNLVGILGASRLRLLRITSLAFASKTRQTYAFPCWFDTTRGKDIPVGESRNLPTFGFYKHGWIFRKDDSSMPISALFSIKFRTRHLGCHAPPPREVSHGVRPTINPAPLENRCFETARFGYRLIIPSCRPHRSNARCWRTLHLPFQLKARG